MSTTVASPQSVSLAIALLGTPGTIDVGLLRQQRDWLLSLEADSPARLAQLVKAGTEYLDGLVNFLDALLDSAEGYPTPGEGLQFGAVAAL